MASQISSDHSIGQPDDNQKIMQDTQGTLGRILETVKRLEDEVCDLRQRNSTLLEHERQLIKENGILREQVVCEYQGAGFRKFRELPKEIRCIIWRLALTVPQTHPPYREGLHRVHYSTVNITMQACKEAKEEGLGLKLPYILVGEEGDNEYRDPIEIKSYVNIENDTIWVGPSLGDYPQIYCSRCELCCELQVTGGNNEKWCTLQECRCQTRLALKALAMDETMWTYCRQTPWFAQDLASCTTRCNARKIYIVMQGEYWLGKQRVCFPKASENIEAPTWRPSTREISQGSTDWQAIADDIKKELESYRLEWIRKLSAKLSTGRSQGEKRWAQERLEIMNKWKIPGIEFVTVKPAAV